MFDEPVLVVAAKRIKSAYPKKKDFDDFLVIHLLSKISKVLIDSNIIDDETKLDEVSLTRISFELQTFMETAFGKNSPISRRTITKIPRSAFLDYNVDGSLMTILIITLKYQFNIGWEIFDLVRPDHYNDGVAIIRIIELELIQKGLLRRPKVFMSRVPAHLNIKLKKVVKEHGGFCVDYAIDATHIVEWDEEVDSLPSELTEEFVRTIEIRPREVAGTALVHWFYFPDSYDEWIPSDHVDGSEPPDTVPQASDLTIIKQWRVCCRFIMDCKIFNEWGNEIDYENIPEGEGDDDESSVNANDDGNIVTSPVKLGAGRKARGRKKSEVAKIKKVPIVESIAVTEKIMLDCPPPLNDKLLKNIIVVDFLGGNDCQLNVILKEKDKEEMEIVSSQKEDEVPSSSTVITRTKRKSEERDDTQVANSSSNSSSSIASSSIIVKQKNDKFSFPVPVARGSSQFQYLKPPVWYNSESVSAIELQNLPVIASNTLEYLSIRCFIVSLYAHNPSIYLSATDCRRKLSGDVCAVIKIHEFLDAFGVININAKAENRPDPHCTALSHHNDYANTLQSSGILASLIRGAIASTSTSTVDIDDDYAVEWSEEMDNSLKKYTVVNQCDWTAVAAAMTVEYTDDSGDASDDVWRPTPQECLARFVSLPLTLPVIKGSSQGFSALALDSIAAGKATQQMRYSSSQLADRGAATLGCSLTQRVVYEALSSLYNQESPISLLGHRSSAALMIIDDSNSKNRETLGEYVGIRLSAIEKKLQLIMDVDEVIDIERERLLLDLRDVQLQSAQLSLI